MLSGANIICFSSIDWDFVWQGHQEIMKTLVESGNRVLFIENTGVRAPGVRDLPRLKQRLLNWWRSTKGFRQEREHLFVYSPIILPFPYARLARWINRVLMRQALQRWMRAVQFYHPIVWTYLPTPLILDLIQELEPELTVYHCVDDLGASSPAAKRISRTEAKLFREADLIFVTSEKLRERAAALNPHVHLVSGGVDFRGFAQVRHAADQVPEDLRGLARPVMGYIGGIHQWIDQELLGAAASRLPHVSFVLVGPCQADVSKLARHPNVRLLGPRPHEDVPHYIKGFDVGMVPYRLSPYTACVYPTKLNEYLAMGIPVVSTDLPEVRRFNAEHGGVVSIAQSPDEFVAAIQDALTRNSPEVVQERIEVARCNDWAQRIERMSQVMEERLAVRRAAPLRWEESLRRLYRLARRQFSRTLLAVGLIYAALFYSPLVWWVAEPLRMAAPPISADAIVVFAGGVGESGKAGGSYQERVKRAVDLYHEGHAPRVIFVSGYTFVFQEAEVMKELAVGQGVPHDAIILETRPKNTVEDVMAVRDVLRRQGWRHILLVSSPYHMRRAVWTWRKLAPDINVVPAPVTKNAFYVRRRSASLEQIQGILHEYVGIVYYWMKGWI